MREKVKILILGGTRFYGKAIVNFLLKDGYDIYTASHKDLITKRHFRIDRNKYEDLLALSELNFDIVIDHICYNPMSAKLLCDAFRFKLTRLIYVSTFDIYSLSEKVSPYKENDVDLHLNVSTSNNWDDIEFNKVNYVQGKFLAEKVFLKDNYFKSKVCILRLSNVVSLKDDPTRRFISLLNSVLQGEQIGNYKMISSFIHLNEIKFFYKKLIDSNITGVFNLSTINLSVFQLYKLVYDNLYDKSLLLEEFVLLKENIIPIIHPKSCIIDSSKIISVLEITSDFNFYIKEELRQLKIIL